MNSRLGLDLSIRATVPGPLPRRTRSRNPVVTAGSGPALPCEGLHSKKGCGSGVDGPGESVVQGQARRGVRLGLDAQRLSCLLVVQTGPHAQGEHLSLVAPQPAQGGLNGTQPTHVVETPDRLRCEVVHRRGLRLARQEQLPSAHAAPCVVRLVGGDAQQPRQGAPSS